MALSLRVPASVSCLQVISSDEACHLYFAKSIDMEYMLGCNSCINIVRLTALHWCSVSTDQDA